MFVSQSKAPVSHLAGCAAGYHPRKHAAGSGNGGLGEIIMSEPETGLWGQAVNICKAAKTRRNVAKSYVAF